MEKNVKFKTRKKKEDWRGRMVGWEVRWNRFDPSFCWCSDVTSMIKTSNEHSVFFPISLYIIYEWRKLKMQHTYDGKLWCHAICHLILENTRIHPGPTVSRAELIQNVWAQTIVAPFFLLGGLKWGGVLCQNQLFKHPTEIIWNFWWEGCSNWIAE